MSNYPFVSDTPPFFFFQDVSGWYGSKTGADDLWVLPAARQGLRRFRGSLAPEIEAQRSLDRTRGRGLEGLLKIGLLPINTQLQAFYNAVGPKNSSDWKLPSAVPP